VCTFLPFDGSTPSSRFFALLLPCSLAQIAPFMMDRIAILGTGLIGGSLGLAWQDALPDVTIVGHDRQDVLETAESRGAIDEKAADPVTAVEDADLVVLATPVGTVLTMMDAIADALPDGAVVTDVASVKQPVLDQAREVLPDSVHFLGGHPMAGAESSGIEHADALLFENAIYALSLPEGVGESALEGDLAGAVEVVTATGARPLVVDAATHDRLAAVVSHLPQLLAVALVNTVAETDGSSGSNDGPQDDPDDGAEDDATAGNLALELAAGGFRDVTRIASSPFDVWRDILVGNEGPILDAVSHFTRSLQHLRNRLIAEDLDELEEAFDTARTTRSRIPRDQKGFLQPLADVYVRAEDDVGVLHELTGCLAEAGLNVKDVELQSYREGTGGTFRFSFATAADAEEAVATLTTAGYQVRRPD
jgi:prephenate dehydrogenase